MADWVLREDLPARRTDAKYQLSERDLFITASAAGRLPQLREGDQIVLAHEATFEEGYIAFRGRRNVLRSFINHEEEPNTLEISLGEVEEFKKPRLLSEYAYSLQLVYRMTEPWRHFTRVLRRIGSEDYTTITEGEVYVRRTAFHLFYDRMPRRVQIAFQSHCLARDINIADPEVSYGQRLSEFVSFLEQQLSPVFGLLDRARSMFDKIEATNRPPFDRLIAQGFDANDSPYEIPLGRLGGAITEAARLGDNRQIESVLIGLVGDTREERFEEMAWILPR